MLPQSEAEADPRNTRPDGHDGPVYIASLPGDARNDDGINLAASINHPVRPGHGIGQWMIRSVRWFAISHPSQPTAHSCVTHTASTGPRVNHPPGRRRVYIPKIQAPSTNQNRLSVCLCLPRNKQPGQDVVFFPGSSPEHLLLRLFLPGLPSHEGSRIHRRCRSARRTAP
jgi:hypothetical protein